MNKKFQLTSLIIALASVAFGQITTTKVAPKLTHTENIPYDSTLNFLGDDVYGYLGQKLYLKGISETLRKFGYDIFVFDYTKSSITDKSNIYKCCDYNGSKYYDLVGKYFSVMDVIKHPESEKNSTLYGNTYFLKLQENETNDIVYFQYRSNFKHTFPFIVVGFFEKQKSLLVGQEFVFRDKELRDKADIHTGKSVFNVTGQKWKCTDLTIEEKFFQLSLVIKNLLGEVTTIAHEEAQYGSSLFGHAYTSTQADSFISKFGEDYLHRILQGKVTVGMTKEMCKIAWGKPEKVIETLTSGNKSEQWVFPKNYLYFDNDILTAIQDK